MFTPGLIMSGEAASFFISPNIILVRSGFCPSHRLANVRRWGYGGVFHHLYESFRYPEAFGFFFQKSPCFGSSVWRFSKFHGQNRRNLLGDGVVFRQWRVLRFGEFRKEADYFGYVRVSDVFSRDSQYSVFVARIGGMSAFGFRMGDNPFGYVSNS